MVMNRKEAAKGKRFVLTVKGYHMTPNSVKHEREVGDPVKGFETSVPATWLQKGYVEER